MEGDLDVVVAAREGLVDRVVDDLVDEVMEAARARRADVHARPQPDGLEALQNGDVFCGVGGFGHQKSPANSLFAGREQCIRNAGRQGVVGRPSRGSRRPLARPARRSSSSSIPAAISAASARLLGAALRTRPRGVPAGASARRSGQRSGCELERARRPRAELARGAARGSSRRGGRARTPRSTRPCGRAASRPARSSPARRCGRPSPRRRAARRARSRRCRPRSGRSGRARAAPRRRAAPSPCAHRPRRDLEQLRRLERQRLGAGRRHDGLADAADPLGEDRDAATRRAPRGRRRAARAAASPAARRSPRPRRAGARARRAAARPASRSCAGRARRSDRDVVQVRAEPGDAALEVALEPARQRLDGRRLAGVVERRVRQAELAGALGEGRRENRERVAGGTRPAVPRAPRPARSTARLPRACEAPTCTRRSAAFRCPTAAAYSTGSDARLGCSRPSVRSK